MFRHEVQQFMLKRNSQDEFRVRNIITRIYEVIHMALCAHSSRMQANLQEVGLILTRTAVHFHMHILPSSLLLPQQTFIRYLTDEGCDVRPVLAFKDPDDFNKTEILQRKCWKYFECPKTRDGVKLCELIAHALAEIAQQKEILRIPPPANPVPISAGIFGILKDPGPHQPSYFQITADVRQTLLPPPALVVSRWQHDPKFETV